MSLPLSYSNVGSLLVLAPLVSELESKLSSAAIANYIYQAENLINAKISSQYQVPVASPLMEQLTNDIALYNIFSKNIVSETFNKTQWPGIFNTAMDVVNDIADAKITLVDSAGSAIATISTAKPWSNTKGYQPTMSVDDWPYSRVSSVRLQDVKDNRQ